MDTSSKTSWTSTADAASGATAGDVVTYTKSLTGEDVERFALASGDHNPLHLDGEYAEETRFERPIVHGMLVSGVVSAALACLPGVVIYISQDLSFNAPVFVGDEVTATCTLTEEVRENMFVVETVVETEDKEVLSGSAQILLDKSPR